MAEKSGIICMIVAGTCPHGNDNAPGECFDCLAGAPPRKPPQPMPPKGFKRRGGQ